MPMTFPAHAAAVLPLKIAAPARWDGVALVLGSAAPDATYALTGYYYLETHSGPALLWVCLPLTVAATMVVRRYARVVAGHLPNLGRFALRDYAVLTDVRHRWYVTVYSALAGMATHVVWDSFTHERATGIWAPLHLDRPAFAGLPWWHVLQYASTLLGGLAALLMFAHIGARHRLVEWHGTPDPVPTNIRRFWTVAGTVALLSVMALPLTADWSQVNVFGVRLLLIAALALGGGALTARPRLGEVAPAR